MKTVSDLLQDADPIRHESDLLERQRDRLRQAVVAAESDVTSPASAWFRRRTALLTTALIVLCTVLVASRIWSTGGQTLQAALRFEVRLAEDSPGDGLREARVVNSDRLIYLHEEIILTNADIEESSVVADGPSRFSVHVQFNEPRRQELRRATAARVGRPVAILIDGEVVAAPVLTSPISASAVINGDYTKAEAERIADGIGIR